MRQTIHAQGAPAAIGPYCHAKRCGDLLFTSGQLGLDPESGALPQGVQAQARQSLANLGAVLAAAGMGFENVVKTTVFLADINDFAAVNEVYGQVFAQDPPARSCVAVKTLPKNALVEIEVIAAV